MTIAPRMTDLLPKAIWDRISEMGTTPRRPSPKKVDRQKAMGKLIQTLYDTNTIHKITFSPDGKTLASASDDKMTVRLWDPAKGKPPLQIRMTSPETTAQKAIKTVSTLLNSYVSHLIRWPRY